MNNRRTLSLTVVLALILRTASIAQFPAPSVTAALNVERTTVYENEVFPVTLSITSIGERLGRTMSLLSMPPRDSLELATFEELQATRSRERSNVREIRRFRCRARAGRPGTVTVAPILRITTIPWNRQFDVRVSPLDLQVLPLPEEGKPPGFSGAVGRFSLEVDVTPRDVSPGDIVTVTMTVSGQGRMDGLAPPRMNAGRGFKVYEPRRTATAEGGPVVFEQVLVPQTTNSSPVPKVVFTHFDPAIPGYATLEAGPFPLTFRERSVPERPTPVFTAPATSPSAPGPGTGTGPAPVSRPAGAARTSTAAIAAFWIAALIAGLSISWRIKRSLAPWALVAIAFVAVLAFPPYRRAVERRFRDRARVSVVAEEKARLAPSEAALATFDLAPGTPVRVLHLHGQWAKIAAGRSRGWVPISALDLTDDRPD
ncbi:MAG: BatD family protein [Lentisphaerae bacterium]|nr:BatD family protein [Lentisphaerota bacterium]